MQREALRVTEHSVDGGPLGDSRLPGELALPGSALVVPSREGLGFLL